MVGPFLQPGEAYLLGQVSETERYKRAARKAIPQGLRPVNYVGFVGTTKVVPFQIVDATELFLKPAKSP